MPCSIIILNLGSVGPLPVLVDDGGDVNRDVLSWFVAEKRDRQKSANTLQGYATALAKFADYWKFHQAKKDDEPIFTGFFEALVHGCSDLCWEEGISTDTAGRYVDTVGLFLDWFTQATDKPNPNPKIDRPLTWGERLNEYRRRFKNDLLFHLLPSTKGSKLRKSRAIVPYSRAKRGTSPKPNRPKRKFAWENYLLLIKQERRPRNLLLWLLLGAGGLRVSEALHLFVNDIYFDGASEEARILLADPTYGNISIPGATGGSKRMTRQEYLKGRFHRIPRDQLPRNHICFAGWKGMKWHDAEAKTADVVWLHPFFGQLFWKTHQEYLIARGQTRPQHPWYFVNQKFNIAEPASIETVKAVFTDTCRRLNFPPPHNVHSLRHLYVDTLVNVCGLPIHQAQILARHRSPESTEIYAAAAVEATRRALESLAGKMLNIPGAEKFNASN